MTAARLPASKPAGLERVLAIEMGISIVVNIAMAVGMSWLVTNLPIVTSGRFLDAFSDIAKTTLGASAGCVIGLTSGLRRRIRGGRIIPQTAPQFLPSSLVLRAAVIGVLATIVLGVPGAAILAYQLSPAAPTLGAFLLFKAAYGTAYAVAVTPVIVIAALRDR